MDITAQITQIRRIVDSLGASLKSWSCDGNARIMSPVAEIEKLEHKLHKAVALLRGLRNDLQPIHRLPPETLVAIFEHTRTTLPPFLPMANRSGSMFMFLDSQLMLIKVCRRWRGMVATSPSMWNVVGNIGSVVESPTKFLKRSRSLPLDVFFNVFPIGHEPVLSKQLVKAIMQRMERVRQFHIQTFLWKEDREIWQSLNRPAPMLESLSIEALPAHARDGVLPSIFQDKMPHLRYLNLHQFTSWPTPYFHGLTSLCLCCQLNDTPTRRLSTSEFLNFLEFSPALEDLVLIDAGPTRNDDDDLPQVAAERILTLKHLRELTIVEWPSNRHISRFLSHISLPLFTKVYVCGRSFPLPHAWRMAVDDSPTITSFLPSASAASVSIQNLSDAVELWLTRFPEEYPLPNAKFRAWPYFYLTERKLYFWGHFTLAQLRPLTTLQLPFLQTLVVGDDFNLPERPSSEMWRDILRCMPQLTTLHLIAFGEYSLPVRCILAALHPFGRGHGAGPSGDKQAGPVTSEAQVTDLLCPLLQTVRLEGMPLHFPLFLVSLASARRECGSPIKRFEVLYLDDLPTPLEESESVSETMDHWQGGDEELEEFLNFRDTETEVLTKFVDEVVVHGDIDESKQTSLHPPDWPTPAYRWATQWRW
ncbi:hypothetical protein WG66_008197 [Moniliophthora roreri]|uniref:Uncharacterized protein n=1 Tax=Moniliophthora roreri TaxID=221103 RepID=A0A0W0F7E6_MONRR|nr:hypothetical protein WG66_008197 [Moniliophthora roreri]